MRLMNRVRDKVVEQGRWYAERHYPCPTDAEIRQELLLRDFTEAISKCRCAANDDEAEKRSANNRLCAAARKMAEENRRLNLEISEVTAMYLEANKRIEDIQRARDSHPDSFGLEPHEKVVVVGACRIKRTHMVGIARELGLAPEKLVTHLEFDAFDRHCIHELALSPNVAGVVLGAVPHKVRSGGSEPLRFLKDSGKPVVPTTNGHGELKCTKTTFKLALETLRKEIAARRRSQEPHLN